MKSRTTGKLTSNVEVTNITRHGLWLFASGNEYFLPFEDFPWFREASLSAILNVELLHEHHLYWPDLDVDLLIDSIQSPEKYPLVATARSIAPVTAQHRRQSKARVTA